MFGLGAGLELPLLILLIVVILFGAKKIPELARNIGRARGEYDRGRRQVEREIREENLKLNQQSQVNRELERLAESLGIDESGKSDVQLREEIEAKIKANN